MPKFVPRERKHRRLAKQKLHTPAASNGVRDSNSAEITPLDISERDARRAQLQEDLRAAQANNKVSSKKKKRLDKYVDTKLRRDEERELIKKLGSHNVDTSLLLSSKRLGRGATETKKESFSRALKEKAAGVNPQGDHDSLLFERREKPRESTGYLDEDDVVPSAPVLTAPANGLEPLVVRSVKSEPLFGSGLKRPLDSSGGDEAVIKRRKRRKPDQPRATYQSVQRVGGHLSEDEDEEEEDDVEWDVVSYDDSANEEASDSDEWNGFSASEDDANNVAEVDGTKHSDSTSEEGESSQDDSASEESSSEPARASAFKEWASAQRNESLGFQPSSAPVNDPQLLLSFKPREMSPDPVAQEIMASSANEAKASRPTEAITIPRSPAVQVARLDLPVVQEEQRIMEAIYNNPVVVVCGATGSGKTTQLPQMLLEGGFGSQIGKADLMCSSQARGIIGVTQPRRVAAVSVAERVAHELGGEFSSRVAHQVRYDTTANRHTAIKFMTDGILLREISQDFVLSKYSVIVIDEAHERSVNTDILIGMLSRIVGLREELAREDSAKYYPLKLVIMSATLRVADFTANERLFRNGAPPIVEAEGKQYTVTEHFSRRTYRDYVSEMAAKVARGHRKLPPGAMLVFLTGQNEIQAVMRQLRDRLGGNTAGYGSLQKATESADQMPLEMDDLDEMTASGQRGDALEGEESEDDSDAEITGLDGDSDDGEFHVDETEHTKFSSHKGPLAAHILPLYAALPTKQQLRVFQPVPEGSRLIVLATNVAETSLTIPGIRYVFDSGRSKEKRYDQGTGVQTFEVDWISKSSAAQRMGRAGRTGPGHVYRLYSSAVYEQFFPAHTTPEILRSPIEGTVLQLKNMEIENVVNFPFPTPPDRQQLVTAERLLQNLGAIKNGSITDVGRQLVQYPLSPRFGQMLRIASKQGNVMRHTIAIVAALAVGDLFIPEAQLGIPADYEIRNDSDSDDNERNRARAASAAHKDAGNRHQVYTRAQAKLRAQDDMSDGMKVLTAVAAYTDMKDKSKFCADFYLREKGMAEVQQLRQQLSAIVKSQSRSLATTTSIVRDGPLPKLNDTERKLLNQIIATGFLDQIAIRADVLGAPSLGRKPKRANEVAYRTLQPSTAEIDRNASSAERALAESVFVHPSSVLAHLSVNEMPKFIVYQHLSKAAPATIEGGRQPKTRMHPLTAIGPKTLAGLAEGTPLLEFGKPVGKIEELPAAAGGDTGGGGGGGGLKQRQCWVGVSLRMPGSAAAGWPLTAWKVLQVRRRGEWVVEKVVERAK